MYISKLRKILQAELLQTLPHSVYLYVCHIKIISLGLHEYKLDFLISQETWINNKRQALCAQDITTKLRPSEGYFSLGPNGRCVATLKCTSEWEVLLTQTKREEHSSHSDSQNRQSHPRINQHVLTDGNITPTKVS